METKAKQWKSVKQSGTDWDVYAEQIRERQIDYFRNNGMKDMPPRIQGETDNEYCARILELKKALRER